MDDCERDTPVEPSSPAARSDPRHESVVAWSFVAAQFVLLAIVLLLPSGDAWPLPRGVAAAATVGTWTGVALILLAAVALRRGLTAAPLPNAHARLRTDGLYRVVRHPIYAGLILFTASQVLGGRSWSVAACGVALVILINIKARWEERRLTERFQDYAEYARQTPRFVPGWRPR